jgi:2-polyprenyl-3-methyl-5-hydroxy-6-metoxy-1,4-benzoquinol methylase
LNSFVTPSATSDVPDATGRCWICGSEHTLPWKARSFDRELQPDDLRITDSHYGTTLALRRCAHCGFIFADGRDVRSLVSLYEQLSDPEYEQTQDTRVLQMRWLLAKVRQARPAARTLLDVGAGAGLLVDEAGACGFVATGVEPSRALVAAARDRRQLQLLQGTFPHPHLAGRKFDVITVVDVIEHVSKPLGLLRDCAEALAPNGIVLVVTPDVRSLAARLLGKRWWHFRAAHVGYFSQSSLAALAGAAGLRIIVQFRAKWFFRVQYVAERLEKYLPVSGMNRLARQAALLRWLYRRTIPLNLRDSTAIILAKVP